MAVWASGKTVTISAPYGGPIYLDMSTATGLTARYTVALTFDNVAK